MPVSVDLGSRLSIPVGVLRFVRRFVTVIVRACGVLRFVTVRAFCVLRFAVCVRRFVIGLPVVLLSSFSSSPLSAPLTSRNSTGMSGRTSPRQDPTEHQSGYSAKPSAKELLGDGQNTAQPVV